MLYFTDFKSFLLFKIFEFFLSRVAA